MTLRPDACRRPGIIAELPPKLVRSNDPTPLASDNSNGVRPWRSRLPLSACGPTRSLAISAVSAVVFAGIGSALGLLTASAATWFVIGSFVAYASSVAEIRRIVIPMVLLGCLATSSPAWSQSLEVVASLIPDDYKNRRERLQTRLEVYRDAELSAKGVVYEMADTLKRQTLARKGEVLGGETISQLNSFQDWLRSGGEIPAGDELAPLLVDYAQRIARARSVLQREVMTMTRSLEKAEQSELAEQLARSFERLGGVLDARSIVAEADFKGYRRHDGSDTTLKLRVRFETVADNVFIARLERDWMYRGHPIHRLEGQMSGAIFEAMTGKSLAIGNGMDGSLHYRGYVMGNTILGTFQGHTRRGKPTQGTFRLDKS